MQTNALGNHWGKLCCFVVVVLGCLNIDRQLAAGAKRQLGRRELRNSPSRMKKLILIKDSPVSFVRASFLHANWQTEEQVGWLDYSLAVRPDGPVNKRTDKRAHMGRQLGRPTRGSKLTGARVN